MENQSKAGDVRSFSPRFSCFCLEILEIGDHAMDVWRFVEVFSECEEKLANLVMTNSSPWYRWP